MDSLVEKSTNKSNKRNQPSKESYIKDIESLIAKQREFYKSGKTRSFNFRKEQLEKLRTIIEENEEEINKAIQDDLNRSDFAVIFTTGVVITEIKYMLEHVLTLRPPFVSRRLKQWMEKNKNRSPMTFLGFKSYVESVPKGVVLIIGPWNYPFLLMIVPLIGAIAAGNCAVLKPSEVSKNTSNVIAKLINNNFDNNFIHAEQGGVEEAIVLTNNPSWDHILFTGGTEIGRIVYQAAAKNLIPVTLELGGKSPAIVDKDVHLKLAARRIVSTKFINAGQTCMAPDYLLVHKDIKEPLKKEMEHYLHKFFGDNVEKSKDFARIINNKQFDRLLPLINHGKIFLGGKNNPDTRFIEPTLLEDVDLNSQLMKEEIFGPILPIIEYETDEEAINFIETREHPLALYIYSKNKNFKKKILRNTNFGGAMINQSVIHYLHPEVPFGGKGNSGFGNYSGKYSFDTFSQQRPVVEAGTYLDRFFERIKLKSFGYPPFKKRSLKLIKLFQRTFSRFRL
ncbi:MAG: Aldehyde dehydrogenase [Candidatus Heimdallarchaeota archaeon LC_3]|nr:MAG: Aldehyde dehydrogenase [Candidatus Heimdallarchaeota archaeon LC_3]